MTTAYDDVELSGQLERITFHNPENLFTIATLQPAEGQPLVTLLGHFPQPKAGETVRVTGHWERHPRFGQQLRVTLMDVLLPETADGIRRYLESGVVKGLGPRLVARLVDRFGAETLSVIETDPLRLQDVRGVGPRLAGRIHDAWQTLHSVRALMAFLQRHGVPTAYGAKLLQAYGENAVQILTDDPFQVAEDIPGAGFHVADRISRSQGISGSDRRRVRACIGYLMDQGVAAGHTYLPEADLLEQCRASFDIDEETGIRALDGMIADRLLLAEEGDEGEGRNVFKPLLFEAEKGLARRLRAMISLPPVSADEEPGIVADAVLHRLALQLSDEQLAAVNGVMKSRVSVVTGGPGTGKTTVIRSIAAVCRQRGRRVCLAAPTGRAARRLSEMAGEPASTIHRLLEAGASDGGFGRDQDNPIDADVVVVDEASMVDVVLMHHLVTAVRLTATLILVGDVYQLPPVGPGAALADIIGSGNIPVFRLERIFRQQRESPIVINAHRVREGRPPIFGSSDSLDDRAQFVMIESHRLRTAVDVVVDLCTRRIPEHFHLHPSEDIQVITPMHKGEVGTVHLNQVLQRTLNPPRPGDAEWKGFRAGDKVMHLKNNYAKEVFNGDIGVVFSVSPSQERITVGFEGREIPYDISEIDDLALAYAVSIHKSQGSEYPAVIIPMVTQHYPLLQRNLLYTAITRGRRLVVIVGTKKAVAIALNNDKPRRRMSSLCSRLGGVP